MILKTAVYITALYGAYRLLTDKNPITGQTRLEALKDRAQELTDKATILKDEIVEDVKAFTTKEPSPKTVAADTGVFI